MNVNTKLALTEQIDSFEIYDFITDSITLHYTSYDKELIIENNTYLPVPIKRSSFNRDLDNSIVDCTISAPITSVFNQYVTLYPLLSVKVKIRKYFVDDFTEYIAVFNGIIKGITINRKNRIATIQCVSDVYELNTKIPYVFVQSVCNNTLFDSICNLSKIAYSTTYVVTINPNNETEITLQGTAPANDYYKLGIMEYQNEKRLVISQVGSLCKIQIPFADILNNDSVKLIVGCDKTKETCYNFFKNIDNFLGMPYVKSGQNPVDSGIV